MCVYISVYKYICLHFSSYFLSIPKNHREKLTKEVKMKKENSQVCSCLWHRELPPAATAIPSTS